MQDNKRVVRSRRLYVSTSITPFFFDQRKKVAEKFGGMEKVIANLRSNDTDQLVSQKQYRRAGNML